MENWRGAAKGNRATQDAHGRHRRGPPSITQPRIGRWVRVAGHDLQTISYSLGWTCAGTSWRRRPFGAPFLLHCSSCPAPWWFGLCMAGVVRSAVAFSLRIFCTEHERGSWSAWQVVVGSARVLSTRVCAISLSHGLPVCTLIAVEHVLCRRSIVRPCVLQRRVQPRCRSRLAIGAHLRGPLGRRASVVGP